MRMRTGRGFPQRVREPYPYPLRLRPAGVGEPTNAHMATADCSVSATSVSRTVAVESYGAAVEASGFTELNLASWVYVQVTPLSCTGTLNFDGPNTDPRMSSLSLTGSALLGLVLYQDGEKIDWGAGVTYKQITSCLTFNQRFLNYGLNYDHKDYAMDHNTLLRGGSLYSLYIPTQTWDPPYIPDSIGLWGSATNCTMSFQCRVTLLWQ